MKAGLYRHQYKCHPVRNAVETRDLANLYLPAGLSAVGMADRFATFKMFIPTLNI